ncbi:MAG: helix-turn-helix transcriptional regulator [Methylocystaceae bacterium]|nr:helix-turn-helix transcriptional regulator [Methylocystaceae bacterium]
MKNDDIQKAFGKRVRKLRKEKGLTQEQLAQSIDRSVDTISNIERGFSATKLSTAGVLAEQLGVELYDLFSADHKTPQPYSSEITYNIGRLIELIGEDKLAAHLASLLSTLE